MDSIFTTPHTNITQADVKRWNKYYADNREKIAQRRKERRALQEKKPVDEEAVKRYFELLAEIETLKPAVALWKLRQTLALKKSPVAPTSPVSAPVAPTAPDCPAWG
jgi:hypothetical protein